MPGERLSDYGFTTPRRNVTDSLTAAQLLAVEQLTDRGVPFDVAVQMARSDPYASGPASAAARRLPFTAPRTTSTSASATELRQPPPVTTAPPLPAAATATKQPPLGSTAAALWGTGTLPDVVPDADAEFDLTGDDEADAAGVGRVPVLAPPVEPRWSIVIPDSSRISSEMNNPTNITISGDYDFEDGGTGVYKDGSRGITSEDGKLTYVKYKTPLAGYNAAKTQIQKDADRGLNLKAFVHKFVGEEVKGSDYVQFIADTTGASPTTLISDIDIDVLAQAMARRESGTIISALPDEAPPPASVVAPTAAPPIPAAAEEDQPLSLGRLGSMLKGAAGTVGRGVSDLMTREDDLGSRLLQLLGQAGGQFAATRGIRSAGKKDARSAARANLINALARRRVASGTQTRPDAGLLGTIASAVGGAGDVGVAVGELGREEEQRKIENKRDDARTAAYLKAQGRLGARAGGRPGNLPEGSLIKIWEIYKRNPNVLVESDYSPGDWLQITDKTRPRPADDPKIPPSVGEGEMNDLVATVLQDPDLTDEVLAGDYSDRRLGTLSPSDQNRIRNRVASRDLVSPITGKRGDAAPKVTTADNDAFVDALLAGAEPAEALEDVLARVGELSKFENLTEIDQDYVRRRFYTPFRTSGRVEPAGPGTGRGISATGRMNLAESEYFEAQVVSMRGLFEESTKELTPGGFYDRFLQAFGVKGLPQPSNVDGGPLKMDIEDLIFQKLYPKQSQFRQRLSTFSVLYASMINNGRPTEKDREAAAMSLPVLGETEEVQRAKMQAMADMALVRTMLLRRNLGPKLQGFINFSEVVESGGEAAPAVHHEALVNLVRSYLGDAPALDLQRGFNDNARTYADPESLESVPLTGTR